MDKTAALNIARSFSDLVIQLFPVSKVVLFGSQVRGNSHPDSDIDIAVLVCGLKTDYLDTATELFRLRKKVNLLIEPILLDESNDKSGFIAEILRTGEVVYNSETPTDH